jgi:BlaI family transcriptional regulator, penicillinase repressor
MYKHRVMGLSKSEEQLMELIWKLEKAFTKDLIEIYPDPKPAPTTIATLLKRMQDKGFVSYTLFGNSRQYFALVKKADYFSKHVKGIIKDYFNNSPMQFASFFTTTTNLTAAELEELKKIVNQEIKKAKK